MKRKNVKEIEKTQQATAKDKLNIRDGIIMLVFVIVFAALLFFRHGSSAAPQSGYIISEDNTDGIVLTFDEKVSIDKACVYLGHTAAVFFDEGKKKGRLSRRGGIGDGGNGALSHRRDRRGGKFLRRRGGGAGLRLAGRQLYAAPGAAGGPGLRAGRAGGRGCAGICRAGTQCAAALFDAEAGG